MKPLLQALPKFTASAFVLKSAGTDTEAQQVQDFAAEQGSYGLLKLSAAELFPPVEAAVRCSAENSGGQPGPSDEVIQEREKYWQQKRAQVEAKITAHQSLRPVQSVMQSSTPPLSLVNWLKAGGNVVVLAGLIVAGLHWQGLALKFWSGTALALGVLFILLNRAGWRLGRLLATTAYGLSLLGHRLTARRLHAELRRVEAGFAEVQQLREAEILRRGRIEARTAQLLTLAQAVFNDHYARGCKAAQLLAAQNTSATARLAFEYNGFHPGQAAVEEALTPAVTQSQDHWKGV